jgi:hypothetical protein
MIQLKRMSGPARIGLDRGTGGLADALDAMVLCPVGIIMAQEHHGF